MEMNFHNKENQTTYATRSADKSWMKAIKRLVPMENISKALDVGCGGGIYSKALVDIGVGHVTGIDFSETILTGAREYCKEYDNISLKHGNALKTGLGSNSYNLILERALIHHIEDLRACFKEGYRVLKDEGIYIIQDRTPEDCLIEGNDSHIRGYFFELFPRLSEKEIKRRHKSETVIDCLQEVGFKSIEKITLWETRKVHGDKDQLRRDLSKRTGRSILHELNDEELNLLLNHIDQTVSTNTDIIEKDRWTIWKAVK